MKVSSKQNMFDIALVTSGSIEAVFDIAEMNSLSITDVLQAGSDVFESGVFDDRIVAVYYKTRGLNPATDGDIRQTVQEPVPAVVITAQTNIDGFAVAEKQSLFDISLIASGGIEAVFGIAEMNGLSVTDMLETGSVIAEPEVIDRLIADYYTNNRLNPATDGDFDFGYLTGIDYWAVDVDFVVQ